MGLVFIEKLIKTMSTEDRLAGSLATPNLQMTHASLPDQGTFIGVVLTVTVPGLIT